MQYESEYGTLTTGKFAGGRRHDTWTSKATGEVFHESAFACGPADQSNRHNSSSCYGGSYDPRCACCYLNFTHTEEKHQQSIK